MANDLLKHGLIGKHNNMTLLLNRIERQFGLRNYPLPEGLKKDDWPQIINEETIPTFSNYFPYCIQVIVTPEMEKDGFFFIDQTVPEGTRIIGVKDIDWLAYRSDARFDRYGINLDAQTWMTRQYALDDIAMTTVGADMMSLFQLGIFINFIPPNKIRLESVNGNTISKYRKFPLNVFIQHPGLHTISPTMMETFTLLAKCDVATAIYNELKYYDNMDTVYVNLDLKLDQLSQYADKREEVVRILDEAHISTSNEYQYSLITL